MVHYYDAFPRCLRSCVRAKFALCGNSPNGGGGVLAWYENREDAQRDILPAMNAGYRGLVVTAV